MKKPLFLLILLIANSITCYSQCNGILKGYVVNDSNESLSNALIIVEYDNEFYTMTLTDTNGYFQISRLENDKNKTYNVYASYTGYDINRAIGVIVSCNSSTVVKFKLELYGKPKQKKLYNACYLFDPEEQTHKKRRRKH